MLVHNKPVPNKYLDPEFAGVKQVSPQELDNLYDEKDALDRLVGQEPGIVRNDQGNIKEVYLIDPSKVDLDKLPERIRYLAENSDGPIAIKYYRQESRLTRTYYPDDKLEDFIAELEISEKLNARFEAEGMKPLLPKKSLIGISADSENGNIFVKGFIAEELIPEKSVVELRTELEDVYLDKEVDFGRILELESRINSKLSESRYTFNRIFEQEGIGWYDADDRNTAIGFLERRTGRILTLTQVLDGNYIIGKAPNSGDIEVYIRFFEIGFGRQVKPGRGYFGGFVDCYFH
ncbi:hypothetical protein J4218_04125 [Candidatus Pacearchaeota archaeon]|nr:hypothetical protein [Candidatus Pacearchaeota archaeon]